MGPCVISLWTHPDVGTGTFFVLVDPVPGGKVPDDLKVQIGIQPESGRLPEVLYTADRDRHARTGRIQGSRPNSIAMNSGACGWSCRVRKAVEKRFRGSKPRLPDTGAGICCCICCRSWPSDFCGFGVCRAGGATRKNGRLQAA